MKKDSASHFRGLMYASAGDCHRNLNPNWSYTPNYLRKMTLVRCELDKINPAYQILDAGCGEGVLVEQYRARGYNIEGLDLNYESHLVRQG